jgi:hypothetical protein
MIVSFGFIDAFTVGLLLRCRIIAGWLVTDVNRMPIVDPENWTTC